MIRDPYIGMPIRMNGLCTVAPEHPPAQNPELPGGGSGGSGNQGGTSGSGSSGGNTDSGNGNHPENGEAQPGTNVSGFDAMYLGSLPIAMAYTPMQQWKTTYSAEKGLSRGTIFPELDLPFEGRTVLAEQTRGGRR